MHDLQPLSIALMSEPASLDGPPTTRFATTSSFTRISGFQVTDDAVDTDSRASSQTAGPRLLPPTTPPLGLAPIATAPPPPLQPAGPSVGWKGLQEMASSAHLGLSEPSGAEPHIEMCCTAHATAGVRRLVKSVVRGVKACQEPERAADGMGGTYFFRNEAGQKVAIFKPCDEEPLAPNNPKGYVGRALGDPGWKSTVRVGEAALREVAAYLLDHDNWARVPHTVLVRAHHPILHYAAPIAPARTASLPPRAPSRAGSFCGDVAAQLAATAADDGGAAAATAADPPTKLGSLQEYVSHVADTSEFGTARLSTRDVHRIGILDIRLFNTDRHAGNILVRPPRAAEPHGSASAANLSAMAGRAGAGALDSGRHELVPIDHGFCLPEALEAPYFEWLHWPQAMLPFGAEELQYVAALDAQADMDLLARELPHLRPECLRVLEVSTLLLQACCAAGLTLAEIGGVMTRPLDALHGDEGEPSELERLCVAARQAVETQELVNILSSSLSGSCLIMEECSEEEEGEEGEDEEGAGSRDDECADAGEGGPHTPALVPQPLRHGSVVDTHMLAAAAAAAAPSASAAPDALLRDRADEAETPAPPSPSAFEQAQAAAAAAARATGGAATAASAKGAAARGPPREEDLLFDWDEEGNSGGGGGGRRSIDLTSQQAPSPLSQASSVSDPMSTAGPGSAQGCLLQGGSSSMASCSMSAALGGSTPGLTRLGRLAADDRGGGAAAPPPGPLGAAHSVHAPGAFMWRGLNGAAGAAARASRRARAGNGQRARGGAAYPPPVVAAPARATNEVLSGLSGPQWAAFLRQLRHLVADALVEGRWAATSGGIGAAMSCPTRF